MAAHTHTGKPLASDERRLGQYQLLVPIAAGGMGTVHLARSTAGQLVAIKLLHPHLASQARFVAMFLDEARLAARIFHRNVVEVFDVDRVESGDYLIAMRYVEGGPLSKLIGTLQDRGEKLSPKVALRIMHDVLLGLHAAHEATNDDGEPLAIVHRDVSPQNVLIDLHGYAQVTDFGVARARGGLLSTHGETIKGKLRYLAPEQLERAAQVDRRADVFAAGIVLWEMFRGSGHLFDGENDAQVLRAVMDAPIEPPGAPSLRLDEVCLRALERDPNRRYATTEELARALEEASRGKLATREEVAMFAKEVFQPDIDRIRGVLAPSVFETSTIDHPTLPRSGPDHLSAPENDDDDDAPTVNAGELKKLDPRLFEDTSGGGDADDDDEHPTVTAFVDDRPTLARDDQSVEDPTNETIAPDVVDHTAPLGMQTPSPTLAREEPNFDETAIAPLAAPIPPHPHAQQQKHHPLAPATPPDVHRMLPTGPISMPVTVVDHRAPSNALMRIFWGVAVFTVFAVAAGITMSVLNPSSSSSPAPSASASASAASVDPSASTVSTTPTNAVTGGVATLATASSAASVTPSASAFNASMIPSASPSSGARSPKRPPRHPTTAVPVAPTSQPTSNKPFIPKAP